VDGIQDAESKSDLIGILEGKDLVLLSAKKTAEKKVRHKQKPLLPGRQKISLDVIVLFTRQFGTMCRVGVPVLRALHIMMEQAELPRVKRIISAIADDVEGGDSLTEAFARHPAMFSPIYCSMLAAGEATGNIPEVMESLCQSMEYETEVKNLIKGALQYPMIVLIALIIAFAVLMGFVVPAFIPLFDQLGGELPPLTKVCVFISKFFTDYWYILIGFIIAVFAAFFITNRTESGKLAIARTVLKIPLVGKLMVYSYMARFGSLLSILQSSGILISEALNITADCIKNSAIKHEIAQMHEDVHNGISLTDSLKKTDYFPGIMQSMVSIGEVSGNLEEMMKESSRHFEMEVRHAVKKLTGALGPILIVGMAVAVGFFAMAIYLPIWDMSQLQMNQ
jgi:type IV pilus assembly protein PilC